MEGRQGNTPVLGTVWSGWPIGKPLAQRPRDGTHIATLVANSGVDGLLPGAWVVVGDDGVAIPVDPSDSDACGVVDPFVRRKINYGESFIVLMSREWVDNIRIQWEFPKKLPNRLLDSPIDEDEDEDEDE